MLEMQKRQHRRAPAPSWPVAVVEKAALLAPERLLGTSHRVLTRPKLIVSSGGRCLEATTKTTTRSSQRGLSSIGMRTEPLSGTLLSRMR